VTHLLSEESVVLAFWDIRDQVSILPAVWGNHFIWIIKVSEGFSSGEIRKPRGGIGPMRRTRKSKFQVKVISNTDQEQSLSKLRHTEVGGIQNTPMKPVSDIAERIANESEIIPSFGGENASYILEDESLWLKKLNKSAVMPEQSATCVVYTSNSACPATRCRETLAWWPTNDVVNSAAKEILGACCRYVGRCDDTRAMRDSIERERLATLAVNFERGKESESEVGHSNLEAADSAEQT